MLVLVCAGGFWYRALGSQNLGGGNWWYLVSYIFSWSVIPLYHVIPIILTGRMVMNHWIVGVAHSFCIVLTKSRDGGLWRWWVVPARTQILLRELHGGNAELKMAFCREDGRAQSLRFPVSDVTRHIALKGNCASRYLTTYINQG
jgi:hypothetical protein